MMLNRSSLTCQMTRISSGSSSVITLSLCFRRCLTRCMRQLRWKQSNNHTHHLQCFLSQHLYRRQQASAQLILSGKKSKDTRSHHVVTVLIQRFIGLRRVVPHVALQLVLKSSSTRELACNLRFDNAITKRARCGPFQCHCD